VCGKHKVTDSIGKRWTWNSSVGRALWDSGIALWVDHYGIEG